MRYCFVLSYLPGPRMAKRINLVKNSGFDVSIICWQRREMDIWGDNLPTGIDQRIIPVPANYGNPLQRIIQTLKFQKLAKKHLKLLNPDIVHVENLDMLFVAWKYFYKINNKPLIVYEIADIHNLLLDKQNTTWKKILKKLLRILDIKLSKYVDILICTSKKYYDVYYSDFIPKDKFIEIPNMPDLEIFKNYKKKSDGCFTIGFIGAIRYKEQMKMLINAAKDTKIQVIFAGAGIDKEIEIYIQNISNVLYKGPYNYNNDIVSLYQQVDCVYSVYDANSTNVRLALPNKLYESILCELPIIVAKGTYLAELVEEWSVGIAVNHVDINELKFAIDRMSNDDEFYNLFVEGCKNIKYKLSVDVYNNLFINKIIALVHNHQISLVSKIGT